MFGTKIFEAVMPIENEFGSGNDLQHNTRTNQVFRGAGYKNYKTELVEHLSLINTGEYFAIDSKKELAEFKTLDKQTIKGKPLGVQIEKGDELSVLIIFYSEHANQTTRASKDLDNMEKPTLDAMQEALGFDDAQITTKMTQKRTHLRRALRIEIWKA